jgi:hypothetical protein
MEVHYNKNYTSILIFTLFFLTSKLTWTSHNTIDVELYIDCFWNSLIKCLFIQSNGTAKGQSCLYLKWAKYRFSGQHNRSHHPSTLFGTSRCLTIIGYSPFKFKKAGLNLSSGVPGPGTDWTRHKWYAVLLKHLKASTSASTRCNPNVVNCKSRKIVNCE